MEKIFLSMCISLEVDFAEGVSMCNLVFKLIKTNLKIANSLKSFMLFHYWQILHCLQGH